ncbi:hypothetical protein [Streptomyces sp. NPDC091212]|uniref:hypothetical protein n=1 Tax=Streptomyces sp. NPDC091212 TaxID=3155191 RepID=UPI00342F1EEE
MRGDDAQRIAAGGDGDRVRKGPRHAAPRKSLLTKLQIPAGKAMALAAMPTAVFVGMGLTPRLAMADDKEIPFAPGPCVTRSDEPDASESPSPSSSESANASGSPSPSASGSGSSPDSKESEPSGSSDTDTGADAGTGTSAEADKRTAKGQEPAAAASPEPTATPTPTPTPSKSAGLIDLDPLGLGDVLGGLLGGGKGATDEPEPSPSATATGKPDTEASSSPSATTPSGGSTPSKPDKDDDAADTGAKADSGRTGEDDDATDAAKDAIKDAADRAGASVEELDESAQGLDAHADDAIPSGADGKEPFPCPTADPEALAAAQREPGIPLVPDDPWQLNSSLLTLTGLDYKGIVEVETGSGKIKKALKFTASSLDIKDLHQTVVYPAGRTAHVKARAGSTSTIRDGEVTMYTEELKGNLFGLIPVTFSPRTPPPLNVPFAFFTDAHVIQAGQFGGTLTIPGLQNYLTD